MMHNGLSLKLIFKYFSITWNQSYKQILKEMRNFQKMFNPFIQKNW